ncbi:hypothetical protein C5O80_18290 [Burkholderia sp. SRS-46]|nr:hypothetical protein C5O80_18290 [Burkholderia sp. SRS-46]
MKRGVGITLCLMLALSSASSMAAGILKLSRTEMTVAPGQPPGELWVENKGDTPLYLDVTQQLVANPGTTPEQLVPVQEVPHPGLLVLPNRLTLAPGQKYRMTLKELVKPLRTQVWRVTFRPKEHIVVEAGVTEDMPAPLFLSIGYGVVIYQLGSEKS